MIFGFFLDINEPRQIKIFGSLSVRLLLLPWTPTIGNLIMVRPTIAVTMDTYNRCHHWYIYIAAELDSVAWSEYYSDDDWVATNWVIVSVSANDRKWNVIHVDGWDMVRTIVEFIKKPSRLLNWYTRLVPSPGVGVLFQRDTVPLCGRAISM
jgi:hypothetical protein